MNSRLPANHELIEHRSQAGRVPELTQLQWLARWMDSAFEIPGLNMKFGLDAILGLVPGLGDVASSLVSLYILQAASERGVSRLTLARMASNILIDWGIGSIPVVGDVFDVYWKSNQKNVELLQQYTLANPEAVRQRKVSDWLFLAMLMGVLVIFLIGCLTIVYFVLNWVAAGLFPAGPKTPG